MHKYFALFSAFFLVGCYESVEYENPTEEVPEITEEVSEGEPEGEKVEAPETVEQVPEEIVVPKSDPTPVKQAPVEVTTPKDIPDAWIDANRNELESIEILLGSALESRDPASQFKALEQNIEGFEVVEQAFLTDTEFIVNFEVAGTYRWIFAPKKQAPTSFFES